MPPIYCYWLTIEGNKNLIAISGKILLFLRHVQKPRHCTFKNYNNLVKVIKILFWGIKSFQKYDYDRSYKMKYDIKPVCISTKIYAPNKCVSVNNVFIIACSAMNLMFHK